MHSCLEPETSGSSPCGDCLLPSSLRRCRRPAPLGTLERILEIVWAVHHQRLGVPGPERLLPLTADHLTPTGRTCEQLDCEPNTGPCDWFLQPDAVTASARHDGRHGIGDS